MRQRAATMLERVAAEARASLAAEDTGALITALESSLAWRDARVADDHDSRYLHPARTVRILLADAACGSAPALIAASFLDTLDPELVPPFSVAELARAEARRAPGLVPQNGTGAAAHDTRGHRTYLQAAALLDAAPRPGDEASDTLEALVTAPADAAVVALAERLDQVRHLHLRHDGPWEGCLHEVRTAYIPAARRIAPQLARRLERWADAFERRLLLRRRTDLP